MELTNQTKQSFAHTRQLSNLKLVSRLLAHELHSQSSAKTITLSRDAVVEMQNTIDLYIEEVSKRTGFTTSGPGAGDPPLVGARNN